MTDDLLHRCAYLAAKTFQQRRGDFRTMLWLTQHTDGTVTRYETSCLAPADIDDATALAVLREEMAADFQRAGVIAYGVIYSGMVTFTIAGSAPLAQPGSTKRRAIVIESHTSSTSAIAVLEIIAGTPPRLGAPQRSALARGRFHDLLAPRASGAAA
jgi:hypothetical protein